MSERIIKNKNILIAGDSWAVGEWDARTKPYRSTHDGLGKYLVEEGNNVTNISRGAYCLDQIYESLEKNKSSLNIYDYIIVFVTDPFRLPIPFPEKFWEIATDKKNLIEQKNLRLRNFYNKLNSLSVPIYLVGGLQKADHSNILGLKNIEILVPSIVEVIIPNSIHWEICFYDYLHVIPNNLSEEFVDWIYEDFKNWENITKKSLFFKGDLNHPNRATYYILKEYLRYENKLDLWFQEF